MRRLLSTIFALLMIAAPLAIAPANAIEMTLAQSIELDYGRQLDRYSAFIIVCEIAPYNCISVTPPTVVYMTLLPLAYGRYPGGDSIIIQQGLTGGKRREVLIHETVHYVQAKVGGLIIPGPVKAICYAEEEAFGVVDDWLISINKSYRTRGSDWWKPYPHCYQWFNPAWADSGPLRRWLWTIKIGVLSWL